MRIHSEYHIKKQLPYSYKDVEQIVRKQIAQRIAYKLLKKMPITNTPFQGGYLYEAEFMVYTKQQMEAIGEHLHQLMYESIDKSRVINNLIDVLSSDILDVNEL